MSYSDTKDVKDILSNILFVITVASIAIIVLGAVAFVLLLLWNWLVPSIFDGAPALQYWQALVITAASTAWNAAWRYLS